MSGAGSAYEPEGRDGTPAAAAPPPTRFAEEDLVRPLAGFRPGLLVGSLVTGALAGLLFYCWGYQIRNDIGVAGINRPVFWGFYITNFVFWIGIGHAGTLISAILRVTSAEWRRPVTRCAEAITVFALSIGGLFPLIHLGRPALFWYMVPIPNSRGLWPNFRSPLVWDMMAITTYLTGSILYLLLPLVPDLAILRDRAAAESPGSFRARAYRVLALGWRGTPRQWHSLEAGIRTMAIIIIPVAVSVHTIVSWDFAMTLQPMWHSTIFGPYFVVGAIYSGIAVLMVAMYLLRRGLHLEEYLSDKVFNNLGLLFVAFAMIWGYFTFAEHLTVWYGSEPSEMRVFWQRVRGDYGTVFWTMIVVNVVVPLGVLSFPRGRRPLPTALVGLGVLLGMWMERFLIVVGTLRFPRLDFTVGSYTPSWVEAGILLGSFGLFALLYFLFVQAAPIVSIWEVREGRQGGGGSTPGVAAEPRRARTGGRVHTLFASTEDLAGELERLGRRGVAPGDIEVRSSVPLHGVPPVGRRVRSWVPWMAVAGGLAGGAAAFLLSSLSSLAYPLPTGGMPLVPLPPYGVITFEGVAIGAILCTVATVLVECGLLRPGAPEPFDAELAAGGLVLSVREGPDPSGERATPVGAAVGA